MSVIPFIVDDILPMKRFNQINNLPSVFDLTPRELKLIRALNSANHLKRQSLANRLAKSHIGKDGFEVQLNVENFKPEEVTIKTVDDSIIIEAKCERKNENEYVSSQYRRRFELPSGFRAEDVISTMSSDGILTVKCPRAAVDKSSVREIKIEPVGPVRQENAENGEEHDTSVDENKADRCKVF